jgi:hypothetical protein
MAKKSKGGLVSPVGKSVSSGGAGKPMIVGKRKMKGR